MTFDGDFVDFKWAISQLSDYQRNALKILPRSWVTSAELGVQGRTLAALHNFSPRCSPLKPLRLVEREWLDPQFRREHWRITEDGERAAKLL